MEFGYIIDYLCETVGPSIDRMGSSDKRVDKLTEAQMCEIFRRYIVGEEGDEGNDFFRIVNDQILCVFNGVFFERMTDVQMTGVIRNTMRRMSVGLVYLTGSASAISKYVIESMLAEPRLRFSPDRRYVCFENCVLDLKTMKMEEHGPQYCTDLIMNFSYKPKAVSALWDSVIGTTVPAEGMRTAFQQFCGAFLLNRHEYKFEYVCFVIGEGQNGKSIICKAMVNVFKNEDEKGKARTKCVTTYTPDQLFRSQQMQYVMADVQGKVMNYCDDVSDKDFSGGDFKAFVSGGEFRGRSPYGKEVVEVTDVPLMLCCANRIPPTTDDSEGYFRRFLIINCPNHISDDEKDPQLEAKLRADDVRAAIFNWMLEGYRQLMANGCKIDMSKDIRELREEMKANSNSARRWIRECSFVKVVPRGKEDPNWRSMTDLMTQYGEYCRKFDGTMPKTANAVSRIFKEMGIVSERRASGTWYCIGKQVPDESVKGSSEPYESIFNDEPF